MKEDSNPLETREWLDALDDVVKHEGPERASFLLLELAKHAIDSRLRLPAATTTPFSNTIAPSEEKTLPGDIFMERRVRSLVRWSNAGLAADGLALWADAGVQVRINRRISLGMVTGVTLPYWTRVCDADGGTKDCYGRSELTSADLRRYLWTTRVVLGIRF